eukprot:SRR837773.24923.p2 GENE.SRR837773.24923~~SRR837773.24923.p2  ORF type:complete len:205 (+),score=33.09 SRR837773.24923:40-654(+)
MIHLSQPSGSGSPFVKSAGSSPAGMKKSFVNSGVRSIAKTPGLWAHCSPVSSGMTFGAQPKDVHVAQYFVKQLYKLPLLATKLVSTMGLNLLTSPGFNLHSLLVWNDVIDPWSFTYSKMSISPPVGHSTPVPKVKNAGQTPQPYGTWLKANGRQEMLPRLLCGDLGSDSLEGLLAEGPGPEHCVVVRGLHDAQLLRILVGAHEV